MNDHYMELHEGNLEKEEKKKQIESTYSNHFARCSLEFLASFRKSPYSFCFIVKRTP